MQLVLIILVAVHLLAVNVAGAGPLVAIWLESRAKKSADSAAWLAAARSLACWSIAVAVLGVALGLVALEMLLHGSAEGRTGAFAAAIRNVAPDRWWFTGGEIVFYLLCMLGYVVLLGKSRVWIIPRRVLAVAAATNLLYHFPALFTILAIVATRSELIGQSLDKVLFHKLLVDPEVMSRVVHVWLASFAVSGVLTSWIAWRQRTFTSANELSDETRSQSAIGGRLAIIATLVQVPVGVWVLISLPENQQHRLIGGDWLATTMFGLAIFTSLGLMHHLAMLALRDLSARRVALSAGLISAVVLMMTAALQLARQ
jgi:hypothetical protein